MTIDFFAEPENVVEYIRSKYPEVHFDYDEIMHYAHHRAFTVAKITKLDLLADIQESLAYASKNGVGFKEWKKLITPTLAGKGWIGNISVTNPSSGEVKEIYVGNRRLKTIYNTNMKTSFAKSRYEAQMQSGLEYFRYIAILDDRTRPTHSSHHGLILPSSHPFWDTHYPPNAWNCRCKVRAYDKEDIKSKGWEVGEPPLPFAHKDWDYHVGKDRIDDIYKQKVKKLRTKNVSKAFYKNAMAELKELETKRQRYVWKSGLYDMVKEVIEKENLKYPVEMIQVGLMSKVVSNAVKKILKIDTENKGIVLTKDSIIHARPKRKADPKIYKKSRAFEIEEIQQIVDVLENIDNAYIDTRNRHDNLLYIFEDTKNADKINLIPIDIKRKVRKFGVSNFIITLDKVDISDILAAIKGGEIIKIKAE